MKSRTCTFVIVTTIIWQTSRSQLQNTVEPSSEIVSKICAIQAAQDGTISKFTKAINIIFTDIRAQMSRTTDNNKKVSNQGTSSTSLSEKETYTAFAQGIQLFLNTVALLSQNRDSCAETTARRIIRESLEMVVMNIYKAIDLSIDRDYYKGQYGIEELRKATVSQVAVVSKGIYIGIRQGHQFPDEIEIIINYFEEKTIYYGVQAVNNIYAGISPTCKTGSEDNILRMENAQREAINALTSGPKNVYASIKFLYLTRCMNQMDMSTTLAILDSRQEEANRKVKQGIDILVSVMKSIASNAMEANRDKMKNQSCISEIAGNEVYEAAFLETINNLFGSNSLVQAVKPSTDTTTHHIVINGLKDAVRLTFEGIKAAQNESYAKCMLQLDRIQNERIAGDLRWTKGLYIAAQKSQKDSDEMTKIINHAYDRTVPYVINATTSIFDGMRFLANVLSESKDSRHDDWSALDTAASKAYSRWTKGIDIYYELLNFFFVSSSVENDNIVSYFFTIRSTRDLAISEFCEGIGLIFARMVTDLKNMPSKYDNSPREESKQHLSLHFNYLPAHENYKNKATVAIRNALNATMDFLATTGLVNSSTIKSAFSASVVATIDIIDDIYLLIDSVMAEECTENVSEMHETESSLTAKTVAFFKSIFDVIRSGQKNCSDKNEAAIKRAENKAITNTVNAMQALYSGIEIFKSNIELRIQGGSKDSFSAMKAAETETCSAIGANLKVIFALIQTLLVSSHSKPNRFSTMLAEIQSAREITALNCQKGLGIILKSMTRDVANTTSTHQTENQPNVVLPTLKNICRQSIESDPVANLTYYTFKTAVDAFFDLIPKIQPEATATVEIVRSGMYLAIAQFVEDIFFAIELIHFNFSSEVLAEIGIMEKIADCALVAIVESYYIPIKYDLEPGTETYHYVKNAETDAITLILKTWKPIFTGLKILFYESFPAMDDGYRAHLPSMDDIENESRFYMKVLIQKIYDTVVYKFVHFSRNDHEMLNITCPCTRV